MCAPPAPVLVVINPGLVPARAYFELADIVVTFEGPFADYARALREMPAWVREISSEKIAHIAYAASSADARELDASSTGAGYVYATNGVAPNPWGSLPPDLEQQERRRLPQTAGLASPLELAVERDLDLVEHLQRAPQRGVGLHAPGGLRDGGGGGERAVVADREVEREWLRRPGQRQLALDPQTARRRSHAGRAEHDVLALEDLVVDRLMDVVLVVVAERLHPAASPSARAARSRRR